MDNPPVATDDDSMRMLLASVALVACGGVSEAADPAPCPEDASPVNVVPLEAGPAPNVDCLETDESIATCMRAQAGSSWTAPAACLRADRTPGKPQKRVDGGVVERTRETCCGFVTSEGVTALCCADLTTCP